MTRWSPLNQPVVKLFSLALSLLLLLGSTALQAQSKKSSNPPRPIEPKIFADYSYAYGMLMAKNLKNMGLEQNETNMEAVLRGIEKAVEGITKEEMNEAKEQIGQDLSRVDELTPDEEEAVSYQIGLAVTTKFYVGLGLKGERFNNEELKAGYQTILQGTTPRLTDQEAEAALDAYLKVPEAEDMD